nr:MAG TPA: hypothetical protein [Caudoviricetes sp.]
MSEEFCCSDMRIVLFLECRRMDEQGSAPLSRLFLQ